MFRKAKFIRTEKVAQGDGKGPVFEAGKAYLMRNDSYDYWMGLGSIVDAPSDMAAENEAPSVGPLADTVIIRKVRGGKYHVYGPNDHRYTDEAVDAGQAEQIRRDVIAGKLSVHKPVEYVEPVDVPSIDESHEIQSATDEAEDDVSDEVDMNETEDDDSLSDG